MNRWVKRVVGWTVAPVLVASLFALLRGRDSYIIDFPPPTGRETYAQILPVSIGEQPMDIQPLALDDERYHGVSARYGSAATLDIVQVRAIQDTDAYIERYLKPRLGRYRNRASGEINGVWHLRGSEPGRLYGWQSHNWLFVIEAANDELFDEAVDGFAYISRN